MQLKFSYQLHLQKWPQPSYRFKYPHEKISRKVIILSVKITYTCPHILDHEIKSYKANEQFF